MVSREDHCLSDLLWRWRSGELPVDIAAVISNHPDHEEQVTSLGIPFHLIPVEAASARRPSGGSWSCSTGVDLLVLARYMQILSGEFLERARGAGDQHPPQLPPRLRRRRPLPPRPRARGEADRRHRPLRDRGARRGADHRPGRDPGQPPRRARRPGPDRPRHRAPGAGTGGQGACRGPRPRSTATARSSSDAPGCPTSFPSRAYTTPPARPPRLRRPHAGAPGAPLRPRPLDFLAELQRRHGDIFTVRFPFFGGSSTSPAPTWSKRSSPARPP